MSRNRYQSVPLANIYFLIDEPGFEILITQLFPPGILKNPYLYVEYDIVIQKK